LGEVVQADRFYLVFLGNRRLGAQRRPDRQRHRKQDQPGADFPSLLKEYQNFSATFP
jgi:hypothetical protein